MIKPLTFKDKYVIVSIGFETTIIIVFGELIKILSTTDLTISAFIPISSSLVIPGFLGTPEVITTTSLSEVTEKSLVAPIILVLNPNVVEV